MVGKPESEPEELDTGSEALAAGSGRGTGSGDWATALVGVDGMALKADSG